MMFLRTFPLALFCGALLFLPAGRWEVPAFWAYPLMLWLIAGGLYTLLLRQQPELVRERLRPPSDRDKATRALTFPIVVAHYALAGVDVGRTHWTFVPLWLQAAGFALVAAGFLFVGWALLTNAWASTAVRIQRERSQTVISHGPYAWVRHPMYSGVVLFVLGSGLALGSFVSWAVLLPLIAAFVRRTLKEERMLRTELEGYEAYTHQVRWRVVPGVF